MSIQTSLETAIETTAGAIYQHLVESQDQDLQNRVNEWSELHGLERLDDPLHTLARQAALNVLLKATLYEHYHQRGILPELQSDVRKAFQTSKETTEDLAFREYLLDDIAWLVGRDELQSVLEARHQLEATKEPAEKIGKLFESLTPQKSRRKLGQFRTPIEIAGLMAAWVTPSGDERVLDPGMGAGALSAAAYREKLAKEEAVSLEDITGVDINELALVMGSTSLNLLDHGGPHNLRVGDFLDFSSDDMHGKVDAVISNPPYTRHHELSEEYKSKVNSQTEKEIGRNVSALSPMYAYFYYRAARFLRPGGRASYITPSEFLETGYGISLKQYLLDEFDIQSLVLFDRGEDSVFDEAMTTSLVSFLEKRDGEDKNQLTRFVRVDEYPGKCALLDAITDGVEGKTDWGFVNIVRQGELDAEDKWTELFDPLETDTSQLIQLSEIASVNRGIATGANDFFCLSESEVRKWTIDDSYLSKLIRNSRSVPYYDYRDEDWERQRDEGEEVWLLYHLEGLERTVNEHLRATDGNSRLHDFVQKENDNNEDRSGITRYLKYGMSDEVEAHESYLARNRTPWFVTDRREPAPILYTYMSRSRGRFVYNRAEARNLNNLHCIYLDLDLDEQELKALLAYLNSDFADTVVKRSGRTYSTGMDKIEPNELEDVPVVNPRELDTETVQSLAELFDQLCEVARQNSADEIIKEIDGLLDEKL